MLCLGIVIAIAIIKTRTDDTLDTGSADNVDTISMDNVEKIPFVSLTKNDAMKYLRERLSKSKSEGLPSGFLPQELMLKNYETDLVLLPSYDDPSEILQALFDGDRQLLSFMNFTDGFKKDDFKLDTASSNYWTVLSVDSTKCSNTMTYPRGITFNRRYLDYYNQYAGYGMSEDYRVKINDFSQDFVKNGFADSCFYWSGE